MRPSAVCVAGALVAVLGACSGKTEQGGGASAGSRPVTTSAAPADSQAIAATRRHLLVVVELEPAARTGRVLLAKAVDLPLPRRRGPERAQPWRVEVLAGDGAVLYAAPLADASELRAEFPDPQTGELSGVKTQKRVAAVTLRLPELEGAAQVRLVDVNGGGAELCRVPYPKVTP